MNNDSNIVVKNLRKQENPVLVTAGEYRIALSVTRALGSLGIPVAVLSSEPDAMTFFSRYCTQKILTPPDHQKQEYISFLEELVKRQPFSGLIFCDDLSTEYVGENRETFRRHIPFLLPAQDWLELALDKIQMLRFASDKGIDLPATVIGEDADDLVSLTKGMSYPLVVKGAGGDSSRHVQIVKEEDKLSDVIEFISETEKKRGSTHDIVVQEYVTGQIYSAIVLCNEGSIVSVFMMKKLLSYPSWGGICVEGESLYDEEFRGVIERFFAKVCWHGIAEVEFVKDPRDRRFKLIELSENFNWGLDLAIASGVNFPLLAYRLTSGEEPRLNGRYQYQIGKKFLWLLPEGILHMVDHPRSIPSLTRKLMNPFLKSDVWQRDFRPVLHQIRYTAWRLKTRWNRRQTPIPFESTLTPKRLLPGLQKGAIPEPLQGDNVEWLFCGTVATYRAIRCLHLEEGDVVLMPDYNCGIEVEGVLEAGARVEFYKVRRDASIDVEDLKRKVTSRTKTVFIIHYFGFPQDVEEILKITKSYGLTLIEDCAHALYSMHQDRYLGTFGDLSIFSIRKTLPVTDGGALLFNTKERPKGDPLLNPSRINTAREIIDSVGRRGEIRKNIWIRGTGRLLRMAAHGLTSGYDGARLASELGSQDFSGIRGRLDWKISSFSKGLLSRTNHGGVVTRRRENFLYLLDRLCSDKSTYPLFNTLPDGVCPWLFPLIVRERDRVYKQMNQCGIEVFRFWRWKHPVIPEEENSEATFLRENLLALPIHQDLTEKELSLLATTLNEFVP
ncbi:MAG: aminotransferase, syn family [Deltaproteobacteria bacterium]|nr:aminotransferase, syn family [Deltaproteobacteria bacterium]